MVSALAAHFTARAAHANTFQVPARGQALIECVNRPPHSIPRAIHIPTAPRAHPAVDHTHVWTTARGARPRDQCGSRPVGRHRGYVDRANFSQFGRAGARPNFHAGPAIRHAAPVHAARAAVSPGPLGETAARAKFNPVCGMRECAHPAKVRRSARHRRRADTPIVRARTNFSLRRIDHNSTAPRAHPGVAHSHAWTTPRGERLRDPARSRPFVRHRGCVDNAHRSTHAPPAAHLSPISRAAPNLHFPRYFRPPPSRGGCTDLLHFVPRLDGENPPTSLRSGSSQLPPYASLP